MIKNLYIPKFKDSTVENFTSDSGIVLRRMISPAIRKVGRKMIEENKNNPKKIHVLGFPNLHPTDPYIFASTHSFPDDIATALCTMDRNAYILTNSVDQLNYNRDMYLLWLNGMIFIDTRSKESKKLTIPKSLRILNSGTSILIYPEGSWNISENKIVNDLYPGVIEIAKLSGRKIVPMGSFHEQGSNDIYIIYGEPIDLSGYTNDEARVILRDIMANLRYQLIEKYSTKLIRRELSDNPRRDWLEEKKREVSQFKWVKPDWEDEYRTFKDRNILRPEDVWGNIKLTPENAKFMAQIHSELCKEEEYDLVKQLTKTWKK